jgi:NADPH:quinone reductase
MRALVATGDPETLIDLREVADPVPERHEALVAVRAVSLNRGELRLLARRPAGWRPGQDIAGVVVRHAADGSGPAEGARVVAMVEQAGWAELVAVPSHRLAVLPDTVHFEQAATLPIAGITALRSLRLGGALLGRRVLITGASGGVGQFAVQLAVRSGAHVTGVVGRAEWVGRVLSLGATEAISRMAELTTPFDFILESVGGPAFREAVRLSAPNATIVLIGSSSGEDSRFQIYDFFGHEGLKMFVFFSYHEPATLGSDLAILTNLVAQGDLSPQIGVTAPWHDVKRVLEMLRNREFVGKAVLQLDTI